MVDSNKPIPVGIGENELVSVPRQAVNNRRDMLLDPAMMNTSIMKTFGRCWEWHQERAVRPYDGNEMVRWAGGTGRVAKKNIIEPVPARQARMVKPSW